LCCVWVWGCSQGRTVTTVKCCFLIFHKLISVAGVGVGVGVVVLETLPAWTLTSWNMKVGSFVVERCWKLKRNQTRERKVVSWIGFRASGVTRAKKRVTAVGCPCLTGLGLRHCKFRDDSSDNYVLLWITLFNIFLFYSMHLIIYYYYFLLRFIYEFSVDIFFLISVGKRIIIKSYLKIHNNIN